jgi:WD40 repeat protein
MKGPFHRVWLLAAFLVTLSPCHLVTLSSAAARGDEPARPRLDRFGDPLPAGALVRMGTIRLRPDTPALGCAFAPDGKTLYSIGNEPVVHAWDPASGKLLRRLPLPGNGGRCFTLTPDGKALVVGCMDGSVRFVDPATGAEQRALTGADGNMVITLSLSADGKTVVSQHASGVVVVWDAAAGKPRQQLQTHGPGGFARTAVLPDGKHFVMAKPDDTLQLVDAATGKEVRAFDMGAAPAGRAVPLQRVQRLALSSDGKLLAYAGIDRGVAVCSVETGKIVGRIDNQGGMTLGLAFAPGGRFLALGGFPGVRVYGVASGKELRHLDAVPASNCGFLTYSPDGKTLAAVGQDGALRLWDVVAGRELHPPVGHPSNVQHLVFLGDGKHLVSFGGDARLVAWEVATGREVDQHRGLPFNPNSMTGSPDGKGVQGFGYDRSLHVWRPGTGLETVPLDLNAATNFHSAVSADGRRVAMVSGLDRKLRLYERGGKDREGRVLTTALNVWFNLLVFTPDGRRLAVTTSDGAVRVWDCTTAREVRTLGADDEGPRPGHASRLMISADGRSLLLAQTDNELHLWEVASGRERLQLPGVPGGLGAVAWSADGRLVARGSREGTVHVFEAAGGKELAKWEGKQGFVQSLAFSPDGRLLASGGGNGTILVWEVPEGGKSSATLSDTQRAALWADLIDADAGRAYRAIVTLSEAPGPALALIKERLKPRPVPPDAKRLEKLVGQLDSDLFAEREKASQELAEAGAAAEDVLRKALDKEASTEVRVRVRDLLERITKNGVAPERLRSLRVIEVLERIGTPAARQVLADFARQANDPMLEDEVKGTLERLGERR